MLMIYEIKHYFLVRFDVCLFFSFKLNTIVSIDMNLDLNCYI